jgi:hypothetical protein
MIALRLRRLSFSIVIGIFAPVNAKIVDAYSGAAQIAGF